MEGAKRAFQSFIETGEVHDAELQLKPKSGIPIDVSLNVSAVRDEQGNILSCRSVLRDITECKKSKEELENIFNLSPDMVAVCTTEGKFLKVNPTWEKVLGYTQKELFDLGWAKLVHPDDVERTNMEVAEQLKGSSVANFVNRYKCKDDSYKTFEWQATFAKEGIVHATARDITKRKKVEDEMKLMNKIFQDTEYVGNVGSWNWITETNEVQWSDNLCRIHGLQPEEFDGTFETASSFYHPDDKARVQKTTQQFLGKKKSIQIEYRIITKDGNEKYLLGDQRVILNKKGDIIRIIGLLKDITEHKKAEAEIKHSEAELQKLTDHLQTVREEERALIASELHDDIGQKLVALKMDMFMLEKKLPKDQEELNEKIQSINNLLNDTIESTRKIYSELRPYLLEHFGIAGAVSDLIEKFQILTGIKSEFDSEIGETNLDKDSSLAIFRILQEALYNVRWHSEATRVKVKLLKKMNHVKMTIRDNGVGIKEEKIHDIKSFGLIGMRKRARFLGGEFEIKGVPDKGTTVKLRIPISLEGAVEER